MVRRAEKSLGKVSSFWSGLAGVAVWVGFCAAARGFTVHNSELNFTLSVPDSYVQIQAAPSPDNLYAFATSDPAEGVPLACIVIQRMHGTIGQDGHIDLSATGIADARLLSGTWKGYTIDIVAGHKAVNRVPFALRAAQIPLRNEGIQVLVLSPSDREASADVAIGEFLAGISGPTNWANAPAVELTPYERGERLGEGMVWFAGIVVGVWYVFWGRRPKAADGRGVEN